MPTDERDDMTALPPPQTPTPPRARLASAVVVTPRDVAGIHGTALAPALPGTGSRLVFSTSTPSGREHTAGPLLAAMAAVKGQTMNDAPTSRAHAHAQADASAPAEAAPQPPADLTAPAQSFTPLRDGQLACEHCGVAVDEPAHVVTHHALLTPREGVDGGPFPPRAVPGTVPLRFAVCEPCHAVQTRASELVKAHPHLVQTWGRIVAAERLTAALLAVGAVERELIELDAGSLYSLILMLGLEGGVLTYSRRYGAVESVRATVKDAASEPWSHTTGRDRLGVVLKYLVWRRMEAVRNDPPVPVAPPAGDAGCLLCGLAHVEVPAPAVVRYGPKEAAGRVWTPRTATVSSLRGQGHSHAQGQSVSGHLCPACEAATQDVGALGISTVERAFAAHLSATGTARSVAALEDVRAGVTAGVHAWALSDAPAGAPWAHLAEHEAVAR